MITLSKDICEVCMKHTAPRWMAVKDERTWCVCLREKNHNGMWIVTDADTESYDKERMKRAIELYVEWLYKAVEEGYKLIHTKKKTLFVVEDKWKDMLLLRNEQGKKKWYRKKQLTDLKIKRRIV